LPAEGNIEEIGDSLPEFELLGYPEKSVAYYIRCPKCANILTNPKDENEKIWGMEWLEEIEHAKKELDSRNQKEMDLNETVARLSVPETIDLTRSETQSTRTTDPDEYNDPLEIGTRSFLGNREIIIID